MAAAGFAATATAVTAIGKAAIESYQDYEQLVGGAAKIFDEMDQTKILRDANNAYKELGVSANQYLAIINDVGATFAATMGDEAGYNTAKIGLKAISDYASGTGKNVDELSDKFTLITRSTSSYQSIADQFSGILPATSEAFLKQAQAAGVLSESYQKLTEVPVAEYQAAVSQMLEKGVSDLGLAGNTVAEATTTISGSIAMTKAAWSNLVTGIADGNADIDMLLNNFIESVAVTGKNVMPVVETVLKNIFTTIEENAPEMVVQGIILMTKLAVGIVKAIPEIIKKIPEIIWAIEDSFDKHDADFKKLGGDIVNGIKDGILRTWKNLVSWFNNLWSSLFSNRKVSVTVDKKTTGLAADSSRSIVDGSHANGLNYVPFDGYIAELHKGEAVIPAAQARAMRSADERPINIVVQSVLDGRVIGETAYKYNRNMGRAYGV